jgi:hypothetical protein
VVGEEENVIDYLVVFGNFPMKFSRIHNSIISFRENFRTLKNPEQIIQSSDFSQQKKDNKNQSNSAKSSKKIFQ